MDLNQLFGRGRDSENYRDTTKIKPRADDDDPKTSSGESANMDLNQFFGRGRDSENYRDTMKIKPKADDDDPKTSSGESANMDDICSCIHEKHSRDFHEGGDSEHYWDITKIKQDGAVEAKFSCDNRDPKPESDWTDFNRCRKRPSETLNSKHWDITKMRRDGAVEAKFFCDNRDPQAESEWTEKLDEFFRRRETLNSKEAKFFDNRDPQASSAQSANKEDICSCIYQNDKLAVTTTAPLVAALPLADYKSAVTTTAPLVAIPVLAATSWAFDALLVHIMYVTITVFISVVLTGFIKGPVKNLWDCIVSKIRQFVRRSSGRVQEETFINVSKPSVKSSTNVTNLTFNINMSPDRDQPEEEVMIQISSGRDQPEEEMIQISSGRDQPEEEEMIQISSGRDQPEEEEMIQISSGRDQPEEEEMIQISSGRDQPEEEEMIQIRDGQKIDLK